MDGEQAKAWVDAQRQRGVRRAKVGGFDVDGVLRGKYISLDKLASALNGGFGFCDVIFGWDIEDALYDKKSVTGWHRGFPDAIAMLDADSARDLPWEPNTVAILADFRDEEGADHPACPRSLLRRVRARAADRGYTAYFACEYEFFFFEESMQSLHEKGFRNLNNLTPGMNGYSFLRSGQKADLMAAIMDQCEAFDIEIEGLHTETGPGVYEVAIRYDELLRAADKAALFKVALKQIAHEFGLSVTFMAKWNPDLPGSSGHLHQSLFRDGKNVFAGATPKMGEPPVLRDALRHYIGGYCKLAPELTALISPTINSYKRYVPGVWAPLTASWGVENRTSAARVIAPDDPKSARLEIRQGAADINAYIAMATCLAAGLHGIDNAIEPPDEAHGDAGEIGAALPSTLEEATSLLDQSSLARELLGADFVDHYVHTRRWEIAQYHRSVSDWELKRYFENI